MLIVKTLNLKRDIQIHEREARVIDVTPLSSGQHVNSVLPSLNRTAIDFVFKIFIAHGKNLYRKNNLILNGLENLCLGTNCRDNIGTLEYWALSDLYSYQTVCHW